MTEFGMVIQLSEKHISRGHLRPIVRGGSPTSPDFMDLLRVRTQCEMQELNFAC